jgi:hypothetical protein
MKDTKHGTIHLYVVLYDRQTEYIECGTVKYCRKYCALKGQKYRKGALILKRSIMSTHEQIPYQETSDEKGM